MSNLQDSGKVYGLLTINGEYTTHFTEGGHSYLVINCKCVCGREVIARKAKLISGRTYSCGCVRRSKTGTLHPRHEGYGTIEYQTWFAMKQRCDNPKVIGYSSYGGRGIGYTPRWEVFANFLEDMGHRPTPQHSLDRINVEGNYCSSNCKWSTAAEQAYNKRKSRRNISGKTGVFWDKKSNKWRVKFKAGEFSSTSWHNFLWDAIYERMRLEQIYFGYIKE